MSVRHHSTVLLQRDEVVAPPIPRACDDRTFGLPPVLHALTVTLFLGFVTMLATTFSTNMGVNYVVFVAIIGAAFAVPAMWARMKREENHSHALTMSDLMDRGFATATGRVDGKEACILVLLLPFMIFSWSVAIAIIAQFTR